MSTTIDHDVHFDHSGDWSLIWLSIRQVDGETWIQYRCGHEFRSLGLAVGEAYRRRLIAREAMQAAMHTLEFAEADREKWLRQWSDDDRAPTFRWRRVVVWSLAIAGVVLFWSAAVVGLLRMIGWVFQR